MITTPSILTWLANVINGRPKGVIGHACNVKKPAVKKHLRWSITLLTKRVMFIIPAVGRLFSSSFSLLIFWEVVQQQMLMNISFGGE